VTDFWYPYTVGLQNLFDINVSELVALVWNV
jgi:hypothetical protein